MTRIAVGGFLHETNTFAPAKATYEGFVKGGGWPPMSQGAKLLDKMRNINVGMPADPAALTWTRLRPGIRIKPNGPVFIPATKSPTTSSATG